MIILVAYCLVLNANWVRKLSLKKELLPRIILLRMQKHDDHIISLLGLRNTCHPEVLSFLYPVIANEYPVILSFSCHRKRISCHPERSEGSQVHDDYLVSKLSL